MACTLLNKTIEFKIVKKIKITMNIRPILLIVVHIIYV